jgi:hypothetical protein
MGATSSGPLSQFPSMSLLLSDNGRHGHSIRTRKLYKGEYYQPPKCLFMVYIRMFEGRLEVQYLKKREIVWDNLSTEVERLFAAASEGKGDINAFDLIVFDEPTVFVVVLDQEGWEFYYPDPENDEPSWPETHDPIVFIEKKAVLVKEAGKWVRRQYDYQKNRAFYDSQAFEIGEVGRAVMCYNFITKNKDGDILEYGKHQDFSFNIYLRVPFSLTGLDERKITIILDPDGQNQGPNTA